jgi:hypothetical protein
MSEPSCNINKSKGSVGTISFFRGALGVLGMSDFIPDPRSCVNQHIAYQNSRIVGIVEKLNAFDDVVMQDLQGEEQLITANFQRLNSSLQLTNEILQDEQQNTNTMLNFVILTVFLLFMFFINIQWLRTKQ